MYLLEHNSEALQGSEKRVRIGMELEIPELPDDLNVEEHEGKQANGGLLGSLLSGLTGGDEKESESQKVELDDLLRAGLAFVQSKQGGGSNTEAIINALIAASPLGESAHRSQSGSLVASTIMSFAQAFQK